MDKLSNNEVVEQEETTENSAVTTGEEDVAEQETQEANPRTEKKYSDEDLDKILARKIARERERLQKMLQKEQEVSELDEREKKIHLRELKADAKDMLEEAGLPLKLANVLDYTDEESLKKSIEDVGECFKLAVEFGVKQRISGVSPRASMNSYGADADGIKKAFNRKIY